MSNKDTETGHPHPIPPPEGEGEGEGWFVCLLRLNLLKGFDNLYLF
jgi:hypothetical protein